MIKKKDIWIFLSHSNKDYEKVRQVRDMLEDQSMRPLMFFLHCINDEEELDTLIKREIDCRTRFILCDSENARGSHWVQKEVEYIISQNRVYEVIDLSDNIEDIKTKLRAFIRQTRIFISYNREEKTTAKQVFERLSSYDFSVYVDNFWITKDGYQQDYLIDTLGNLNLAAEKEGCIISIMNERILNQYSAARGELIEALNIIRKSNTPFIDTFIPFVTKTSLIDKICKDPDLSPLQECNIQSLEPFSADDYSDVIMKTVLTRLMTPGSLKVQANNFANGINTPINTKEAKFLQGILQEITNKN